MKSCAITGRIKKYRSVIKKNNKKHDKIVFLGKDKLNTIKFVGSKDLIVMTIFFSVKNVSREYNEIKKNMRNI